MGIFQSKSKLAYPKVEPEWEVLSVVSDYLDPKSLAAASCVSKAWNECFSSDLIWEGICSNYYDHVLPLAHIKAAYPSLSYARLYAMAFMASKLRIRTAPSKPRLSIDDLIFVISITDSNNNKCSSILSKSISGIELRNKDDLFRFDVNLDNEQLLSKVDIENATITWNVVLKGFVAAFTMINRTGKMRLASVVEESFSEELPLPPQCNYYMFSTSSGIVSELQLGFASETKEVIFHKKVFIDKLRVGIFNCSSLRYMTIDEGLKYLEYFLLSA